MWALGLYLLDWLWAISEVFRYTSPAGAHKPPHIMQQQTGILWLLEQRLWRTLCEGHCVKDTVWRTLSKTPLSALNSLYHEVLASCWCNSVYNETLIRWDDHCLHIYLINIIRSWHAIQSELDLNNVCVYYARNDIWSSSSFDPVTDVVRV